MTIDKRALDRRLSEDREHSIKPFKSDHLKKTAVKAKFLRKARSDWFVEKRVYQTEIGVDANGNAVFKKKDGFYFYPPITPRKAIRSELNVGRFVDLMDEEGKSAEQAFAALKAQHPQP